MFAITTENLTKIFPNGRGIKDLTINIDEGEVVSFLGVNGAGKTTSVRMLAGMIKPTSGTATVLGRDIIKDSVKIHETIGLLTETPGFYEKMSIEMNLRFFAQLYENLDYEKQIDKYLGIFELTDRRKEFVSTLSKGLKQRLAICRAMIHEPKILFFDEPTSGLDPESALNIKKIIKKLKSEGRTILLCTHNLSEADELSDRIAIINGRLLEIKRPAELKKEYFRRELAVKSSDAKPENLEKIKELLSNDKISEDGIYFYIDINDKAENIKGEIVKLFVSNGIDVQESFERERTLEDAYMKAMARGEKNE